MRVMYWALHDSLCEVGLAVSYVIYPGTYDQHDELIVPLRVSASVSGSLLLNINIVFDNLPSAR